MIAYWKPFEIDESNKRIVLGNMGLSKKNWGTASHVLIPPSADLFAPVEGWPVITREDVDDREGMLPNNHSQQSVYKSVFSKIDSNHATTFYVVTRWPERVLDVWPMPYKNVCYTLQINRQADLSKVPDLLKLKDLCGGLALRVEPEEEIDLTDCLMMAWAGSRARDRIDQLFIAGGNEVLGYGRWMVNAKKIKSQSQEANIPVYVESDYVPDDLRIRELASCS